MALLLLTTGWKMTVVIGHAYLSCGLFHSTYCVVSISLFGKRDVQGVGNKWYPNASLFTHFEELQSLYLVGNNIGGWIMLEVLCELRNLEALYLGGNSLDDGGLPRCLARCGLPSLRVIYLQHNSFNLSAPLLSALCGLRNLRVLDLSHNVLSNGSLPPCMLDTFSSLESLSLWNFTFEQSPNLLTALCGATRNLRKLDLSDSNLNVERIPPCPQQNLSSLANLNLRGTFTKNYSTALLKGLICGWKKLKVLDLRRNGLSDESLPSCLFHNNSMLEELYLSSNNLKGSLGFSIGTTNAVI
ncbi:receptor-like protein 9b [Telopea speciosissima]|uniref:receptor-like protein 9b n=1 Tax=Telopea speciosissima TaxID=54955 RepID=UPI001CC574E6|nr:receptor-like protein 9b [Telopea speciosissima]